MSGTQAIAPEIEREKLREQIVDLEEEKADRERRIEEKVREIDILGDAINELQRREHIEPADPYYEQMRNFAAVIRGTEKPVLSGRDGLLTLATTLAITESAKDGQPIRIDDMLAGAGHR